VNIPKLAATRVEIFFTQVFRDGLFSRTCTPQYPGACGSEQYIALDFGIMGTLTEVDKQYLARNFLAFFRATTKGGVAHLDPAGYRRTRGWTNSKRQVRAVCEPVFDRPLKDISSARAAAAVPGVAPFNVEIQPHSFCCRKPAPYRRPRAPARPELDCGKTQNLLERLE